MKTGRNLYGSGDEMKNKFWVIVLYVLQAIPIPFSLISILGSIISLANIGMVESTTLAIVSFLAMFLADTYTITYVVSFVVTVIKKKVKFYSFLPVIHLIVAVLFMILWDCL